MHLRWRHDGRDLSGYIDEIENQRNEYQLALRRNTTIAQKIISKPHFVPVPPEIAEEFSCEKIFVNLSNSSELQVNEMIHQILSIATENMNFIRLIFHDEELQMKLLRLFLLGLSYQHNF